MNVSIKSIIPIISFGVTVNLNVGSTVRATFKENISQGTSGVPLKVVIKWLTIPTKNIIKDVKNKLIFIFYVHSTNIRKMLIFVESFNIFAYSQQFHFFNTSILL